MADTLIPYLDSHDTAEEARRIAYEAIGVTYIKGSALTKAARASTTTTTSAGHALSSECKRAHGGHILIVQAFEGGVAYCVEDYYHPALVRLVTW